jgi:hypothetical protein
MYTLVMICNICGCEIDPSKEAYSYRKIGNGMEYWHYSCTVKETQEIVKIIDSDRKMLCEFLKNLESTSDDSNWIHRVRCSLRCDE